MIPLQPVLINAVVAGLIAGLLAIVLLRPRRRTRLDRPAKAFLTFVLLYVIGDAVTLLSSDMLVEQVGIAVLYTGSLWSALSCWWLALRYAEAQSEPFRWDRPAAVRVPAAIIGIAWLIMLTNPWHGLFVTPVIGAHNQKEALWLPCVSLGWVLVWGSILAYVAMAVRTHDPGMRRNSLIMAVGITFTLLANHVSFTEGSSPRVDITSLGLLATVLTLLYGVTRTRLMELGPVAAHEIIRHDPHALLLVSPNGRVLESNPAARALLEIPDDDAFGQCAFEILDARLCTTDNREIRSSALVNNQAHGNVAPELLRLSGSETWIRLRAACVPGHRTPSAAIAVWLIDVTDLERAHEALKRDQETLEARVRERTAELAESEARYRAVSQLSSDVSFAFRRFPDGRLVPEWLTDAAWDLTGYSREELEAIGWETPTDPDDRAMLAKLLGPLSRGEGPPLDTTIRVRHRDGNLHYVELHADFIDRGGDGSIRMIGSARDITERRLLEQRMQEAQRLESLGVLAGGIAHDFNNLLSVVLGNSALALEELGDRSDVALRIERIRSAGNHAAQLVDQMLTYAGRATPKLRSLDVSLVVNDTRDLIEAAAAGNHEVTYDLDPSLPRILGDETQIRQVLMNLVGNACEAGRDASTPVRVSTGLMTSDGLTRAHLVVQPERPHAEYVFLEVADAGTGMDEETQTRIFDPFYSTRTEGRGLGLAVVHGIVRAHGAGVTIESRPGEGTRFRVLLPTALAQTEGRLDPGAAAAPDREPSGATVLIADDDDGVREVAAEFLGRAGFSVVTANSGAEAIAVLEATPAGIDLALVDLSMPGMDGAETLRALKRLQPKLPVILISGYAESNLSGRLADLEYAGFLRKPFDPDTLVASVSNNLTRGRGNR